MTLPPASTDRVLNIYLTLAQYPVLSTRIRARMRRELFERGVITPQAFEAEVREQAIRSQAREGLHDPFGQETHSIWELRLNRVREHLTDFYFAYNLPYELFDQIVRETLQERISDVDELMVSFNPELAPQDMLFEQAFAIEKLAPEERFRAEARLQEIKVVLIRTIISDQLSYIKIAKEWFTVSDLYEIRKRKIGQGKIGGKAAGMLLAVRILSQVADEELRNCLRIPESYFLGADLMYTFMATNHLLPWSDQKYKTEDMIRADYPQIVDDFLKGEFPGDILEDFADLLDHIGPLPIIVRSSSLLEDNLGTSFAGKYESVFVPNQGTPEENLEALSRAIRLVYASALNPDALLYRRSRGLQDYDERMAILIQVVEGERYGDYYFPQGAGVGFSRNLYRWSQQIQRDDGFLRLVWGLGTRAVERVDTDYPRLVALSHPMLRPESSPKEIRRYSQHYVDVIDLNDNSYKTLPVQDVLEADYPILRFLVHEDRGGFLTPLRSNLLDGNLEDLVITYDELLRRTPFADRMRTVLRLLETHYQTPVDTEFTLRVLNPREPNPDIQICLLQCRPQSHFQEIQVAIPKHLPEQDVIIATRRMVPQGHVDEIRWVLFVTPEGYYRLPTPSARSELGRAVGRLNSAMEGKVFICVGPGRWGTTNPDLGVHIGYGDIYNTRALVELSGKSVGAGAPEPSFGTHFFQDLVEAHIYPLGVFLDDKDAIFNRAFFYQTPNHLTDFLPNDADLGESLRVIDVADYRPGHHLQLVMDELKGKAAAFLEPDEQPEQEREDDF
ncbi:MAG: PEP/pyruvate-binding domain-containing protein [Anaerolineales bacterium]